MIPVVLVVEDHHRGNVQSAYFEGVEGGKCRVDTAESPVAHQQPGETERAEHVYLKREGRCGGTYATRRLDER